MTELTTVGLQPQGLVHTVLNPPGSSLGESVAWAGDLNGDGYADFLASDSTLGEVVAISPRTGTRVFPPVAGIWGALAGGADLDSDRVPDFVVLWPGRFTPGELHVRSGRNGNLLAPPLRGLGVGGRGMVRFIADKDGDGVQDLLFNTATDVQIRSGRNGNLALIHTFQATAGNYGWSACEIDDIDGDRIADLAIGSPSGSGQVELFSGNPMTRFPVISPMIRGATGSDQIGSVADVVSDVDGDGTRDLVVAALSRIVEIYSLRTRSRLGFMRAIGEASVAVVPDLDGDGLRDLIVAADTSTRLFATRAYAGSRTMQELPFRLIGPSQTNEVAAAKVPNPDGSTWFAVGGFFGGSGCCASVLRAHSTEQFVSIGRGCSAQAEPPTLTASLGNGVLTLSGTHAPTSAGALLIGSQVHPPLNFAGCDIYIDPSGPIVILGIAASQGNWSLPPIRLGAGMTGAAGAMQALFSIGPSEMSNGLNFNLR
jgi:hypothetical protein